MLCICIYIYIYITDVTPIVYIYITVYIYIYVSDLQLGHLGEFRTDILHDVNHRQEGSQGDGVVEDAGGIQRHVDAHEQGAQPFGEVPS